MLHWLGRVTSAAGLLLAIGACGSAESKVGTESGGSAGARAGAAGAAGIGGTDTAASGAGGADTAGGASGGSSGANGGGSGGTLVGAHCSTAKPFGTPQAISELNTAEHEAGARLTSDELSITYLCVAANVNQVCLAQRSNRKAAFGKPTVLIARMGGVPWISDDLLTLFYEDTLKNSGVSRTQRATLQEPFAETGFSPYFKDYGDPFVVGGQNGRLYLSAVHSGGFAVMKLKDWEPGDPQLVPSAGHGADARPALTPDELTLYFGSSPRAGTGRKEDIWVQERPSVNDPFNAAVNVGELNTQPQNFPSWVSPDGCRLYFDAGTFPRDLYVAERN